LGTDSGAGPRRRGGGVEPENPLIFRSNNGLYGTRVVCIIPRSLNLGRSAPETRMPAKKPAAKSKKASKPAKTVVRKVTPAKKAAKPKPSPARVAEKRASEKPVVKKSPAAPKAAAAAPKAAPSKTTALKTTATKAPAKAPAKAKAAAPSPVPAPKGKAVAPAPKAKEAKAATPAPVAKATAKAAPADKASPKAPTYVTAVAERSTRPRPATAPVLDPDDPDYQEPGANLLAGPRNVRPYVAKRGEQYMGKEQLDHFRQILSNWKRDLMEEVDRTVHHMKDEAANFPDPNDRATQESEFSLELRTRDRERKLIRKIDEALKRIEDGSYGYCNETGEEIGVKRLEARPVATLSVEAQERRERREKQYGDRDDRYR
jgi:DnaK suppressor protein